jgi:hypothetical protein
VVIVLIGSPRVGGLAPSPCRTIVLHRHFPGK